MTFASYHERGLRTNSPDELEREQGDQTDDTACQTCSVDYTCKGTTQSDVQDPVEQSHGRHASIGRETKVDEQGNDGNRSDCDGAVDKSAEWICGEETPYCKIPARW
jgi:hypothetical protein